MKQIVADLPIPAMQSPVALMTSKSTSTSCYQEQDKQALERSQALRTGKISTSSEVIRKLYLLCHTQLIDQHEMHSWCRLADQRQKMVGVNVSCCCSNNVVDVGWSPDDSLLASCSLDNLIVIWTSSGNKANFWASFLYCQVKLTPLHLESFLNARAAHLQFTV